MSASSLLDELEEAVDSILAERVERRGRDEIALKLVLAERQKNGLLQAHVKELETQLAQQCDPEGLWAAKERAWAAERAELLSRLQPVLAAGGQLI